MDRGDGVSLGLRGFYFDMSGIAFEIKDALGGILEGHGPTGFSGGDAGLTLALWVKGGFAKVVMGEDSSVVFHTKRGENLDKQTSFLVIVFGGTNKGAYWLCNDKLGLESICNLVDFTQQSNVCTAILDHSTAIAPKLKKDFN